MLHLNVNKTKNKEDINTSVHRIKESMKIDLSNPLKFTKTI